MVDPVLNALIDIEERRKAEAGHAMSLGRLCMTWAALDRTLDRLFEPILRCEPSEVASILTNIENISSRCDILIRLLVNDAPGKEYRTWLTALIRRVSGELAPLRNRYVHDHWEVSDVQIIGTDKRAKIGKAQSRLPETLSFDTRHVTNPEDVDKLTARITAVLVGLAFAEIDLRQWRKTGQHLEPHSQYIEASKPNARYRTPREIAATNALKPPTSAYVFD